MNTMIADISLKTNLAVVGVSTDPAKYGHRIFTSLVKAGYPVTGLNSKGGQVAGQELYKSLFDLPIVPDVVITVVPPQVTLEIVKECRQLKVPAIWMQPGSGSDQAVEAAVTAGLKVMSDSCFMTEKNIW